LHDVDSGALYLTLSDGGWICGYVDLKLNQSPHLFS